jgi:hypothetical protein
MAVPDRSPRTLVLLVLLALLAVAAPAPFGGPASAHPGPHDPSTGKLTIESGGDADCARKAPGSTCTRFSIQSCHGAATKLTGYYARANPPAGVPIRAALVIFSGGSGAFYWQQQAPDGGSEDQRINGLLSDLRGAGFVILQVRWASDWLAADAGQDDGLHMACRPALISKYLHDHVWAPLGKANNVGACGFCLMGVSGGASSVAWQLTHFMTESYVDAIFPSGGPPHAAMAKGCVPSGPAESAYDYLGGSSVKQIDAPFKSGTGRHCRDHDASFRSTWDANSIDTPEAGGDHDHPATRVHLIDGGEDRLRTHGYDWMLRMWAEPGASPYTGFEIVPGGPHSVSTSDEGMARLKAALLLTDTSRMAACNNGLDDDWDGLADESDPSCTSTSDASEKGQDLGCDNGLDDDADGFVDFRTEFGDAGCSGASDDTEGAGGGGGGGGPTISIGDGSVTEPDAGTTAACSLTITLSAASTQNVTVQFSTASGTATAGTDYSSKTVTVTFTPGQVSRTVGVRVMGDGSAEDDETLFGNLSNPVNGTIGDPQGVCTILNDD